MPETIAVVGPRRHGGRAPRAGCSRRDTGSPSGTAPRKRRRRWSSTAPSPREAAAGAGVVITFLADDRALEGGALGPEGIAARLGPGGVHLSMSTIAPETARRLVEAHRERGAA